MFLSLGFNLVSVLHKTLLPRLKNICILRQRSISGVAFHEKNRQPFYFSLIIFRQKQRNDSIHNCVTDNKTNCGIHSNHAVRQTEMENQASNAFVSQLYLTSHKTLSLNILIVLKKKSEFPLPRHFRCCVYKLPFSKTLVNSVLPKGD